MHTNEFTTLWPGLPFHVKALFIHLTRYSTERNKDYAVGYVTALFEHNVINKEQHSMCIRLVNEVDVFAATIREGTG